MYNVPGDIRNGLKIEIENVPYVVTYFQFVKPGKGTAFTRMKMKSLQTGATLERTYRSGEKLAPADIREAKMQYLYDDDDSYHFMDTDDYSQLAIEKTVVGPQAAFLMEEMMVDVLFFHGQPMNIELPNFVELEVTYCEPAVRGNTSQGATKTAKVQTGAEVQVPLFIDQGEVLRIDTRTGEYCERVRK